MSRARSPEGQVELFASAPPPAALPVSALPKASRPAAADDLEDPAELAADIIGDLKTALDEMEAVQSALGSAPAPRPWDLDPVLEAVRSDDPTARILHLPARRVSFVSDRKGDRLAGAVVGGEPCFVRVVSTKEAVAPPGIVSLACRPVSVHAALLALAERAPDAAEALLNVVRELAADDTPGPGDVRGSTAYFHAKMEEGAIYAELSSRCSVEAYAALVGKTPDEANADIERQRVESEAAQNARRVEARTERQELKTSTAAAHAEADGQRAARRTKAGKSKDAIEQGMRALTARQQELLGLVRVENNMAVFDGGRILDWGELKTVLEGLGGKYLCASKNKPGRFTWKDGADVEEIIRVATESGEILDPKKLGFFATPPPLADALIGRLAPRSGQAALDPNGGRGALLLAFRRACPEIELRTVELLPENAAELRALGFEVIEQDFLELDPHGLAPVDLVGMNPPFGRGADVRHVLHAARFLRPAGRGGAIMSGGTEFRRDALTEGFRLWLEGHDGGMSRNPNGAFKESGTMIRSVMVWWTACTRCADAGCQGHLRASAKGQR
jgi:hypothetical protein